MKKNISIVLLFMLAIQGCYLQRDNKNSEYEKMEKFVEEIILPTIPDGYTYKKADMYIDSAFSNIILLPEIREAAMNIQELQQDLEKCKTLIRDSLEQEFFDDTNAKIASLQQLIKTRNKSYKSKEFCGWKITFTYRLLKNNKDSLAVISLLVNKKINDLLIDEIMTPNLTKEYKKLSVTIKNAISSK